MNPDHPRRTVEVRTIDGVEALVNTDPGELFIDLPASNPRYILVRVGDRIQEGDVEAKSTAEMSGPLLTHWEIDSISAETVTGTDTESGQTRTWDRDALVRSLGGGELSAELTSFDRVSVVEIESWDDGPSTDDPEAVKRPYVIVTAYGNNGEKFTQLYVASRAGDWDSLAVIRPDPHVEQFDEPVRQRFDEAVRQTLEVEQRFH